MKLWNNESEKFALMKEKLYTPVVGDILDNMGYYHQFLPQDIRPLREDMKVAGKAMTVLMIDVYGPQKKPFGFLTEALDQLEERQWEQWSMAGIGIRLRYCHRIGPCFPAAVMPRIPASAPRWWITAVTLR